MGMKEQRYTSTPLMGHMACTEPQCLYKGALYLYFYEAFIFGVILGLLNSEDEGAMLI
jgi:hypothetical protein